MIEPFSLPLAAPLETADGRIERREGFLVRVERGTATGVGEATPLAGWTESSEDCERALGRAVGERGDARGGTSTDGDDGVLAALDPTATPAAHHGVATALADAGARDSGAPLYRWLANDRVRCRSVAVNATVGDGGTDETVDAARSAVAEGFDCLKLKVGARPVAADLERVRAVREAVGPGVTLRLDANGAWDREGARGALAGLADLDVAYVEQPVAADDLAGLAALRDGPVDVAVDETLATHGIGAVLAAEAADVAVLKPMALGGPRETLALADRAREAGVDPVVTTTVDAVVARTAAVHVAAAVRDVRPCGLATADLLAADLGPDPAPVTDGRIAVPQGPGLGIDPGEVGP